MLRQIIAYSLLSLGGFSAIFADPINRNSNFNELTNDCVSNSSACGVHNVINVVTANNGSVVRQKDEEETFADTENALVEEGRRNSNTREN